MNSFLKYFIEKNKNNKLLFWQMILEYGKVINSEYLLEAKSPESSQNPYKHIHMCSL